MNMTHDELLQILLSAGFLGAAGRASWHGAMRLFVVKERYVLSFRGPSLPVYAQHVGNAKEMILALIPIHDHEGTPAENRRKPNWCLGS
jgi:hypothetical protein